MAEAPGRDASVIPTIGITAASLGGAPASIPADIRAPGGERSWNIRRTSGTIAEAKRIIATHRALLAHCKQRLGARAPLAISIEAALPRNSMGKIVRRELAEKIATSLPARLR